MSVGGGQVNAANEGLCKNTDRELWRGTHPAGDYYADSVHVTEHGWIGFNVGGFVVEHTPRQWVDLAWPPCEECGGRVCHIHWCSAGRPAPSRLARIRALFARCASRAGSRDGTTT